MRPDSTERATLLAAALVAFAAPASGAPPVPDAVTRQLAASAGTAGGVAYSDEPGVLYDDVSELLPCGPNGEENTGFASAESVGLYGTIVAPNHIEGLGAAIVQADTANGGALACGPGNSASANVLFEYWLGLHGPGGVLVPVDVTIRGDHSANNSGFAGADVCVFDGTQCVETMGEQSDFAPHGGPTGGSFDVTDTLMMDPDTD
ncbi:MAG: hypothetical protein ACQGVC_08945, partial [Myxococcota bacterium]